MHIYIGIPQGILLLLIAVGVFHAASHQGQRSTNVYDLSDVTILPALLLGLLYWGGFFE